MSLISGYYNNRYGVKTGGNKGQESTKALEELWLEEDELNEAISWLADETEEIENKKYKMI